MGHIQVLNLVNGQTVIGEASLSNDVYHVSKAVLVIPQQGKNGDVQISLIPYGIPVLSPDSNNKPYATFVFPVSAIISILDIESDIHQKPLLDHYKQSVSNIILSTGSTIEKILGLS